MSEPVVFSSEPDVDHDQYTIVSESQTQSAPVIEGVRCSTPLSLPLCPLEFSVIESVLGCVSNDDTSSEEDIALFEGSVITLEKFKNFFTDFIV